MAVDEASCADTDADDGVTSGTPPPPLMAKTQTEMQRQADSYRDACTDTETETDTARHSEITWLHGLQTSTVKSWRRTTGDKDVCEIHTPTANTGTGADTGPGPGTVTDICTGTDIDTDTQTHCHKETHKEKDNTPRDTQTEMQRPTETHRRIETRALIHHMDVQWVQAPAPALEKPTPLRTTIASATFAAAQMGLICWR